MEKLTKSFACEFKVADATQGIVEAIVSVFGNVDRAGERVMLGAFKDSIARKLPKGVWMHDWEKPVAKTLEARELAPGDPMLPAGLKDNGGLYVKGQFNLDTQRGREAFSDLKGGFVDEFSIGYQNIKTAFDEETEVRDLIELELFEWSPVLVGANSATALIGAKGGHPTFAEQFDAVVSAVEDVTAQLAKMAGTRAKDGRVLSDEKRAQIVTLRDALDELHKSSEPPAPTAEAGDVLDLMRKHLAQEARLVGILE